MAKQGSTMFPDLRLFLLHGGLVACVIFCLVTCLLIITLLLKHLERNGTFGKSVIHVSVYNGKTRFNYVSRPSLPSRCDSDPRPTVWRVSRMVNRPHLLDKERILLQTLGDSSLLVLSSVLFCHIASLFLSTFVLTARA
jgi:hypothetical protein